MNANIIVAASGVVALCFIVGIFAKRRWVGAVAALAFFSCIMIVVIFGFGGLRASIEQARANGRSESYVQGMIDRNGQLKSAKAELLISSFGALIIGVSGWVRRS